MWLGCQWLTATNSFTDLVPWADPRVPTLPGATDMKNMDLYGTYVGKYWKYSSNYLRYVHIIYRYYIQYIHI
jgi:hypothetical protein